MFLRKRSQNNLYLFFLLVFMVLMVGLTGSAVALTYSWGPLSDNTTVDKWPQISGDKVAWYNYDSSLPQYSIILADVYSGPSTTWVEPSFATTIALTAQSAALSSPQVSMSGFCAQCAKVAWYGLDGSDPDYEIFYYNGSTVTTLTNNSGHDWNPQISGDNMVWKSSDNTETSATDIFYYDGASMTGITGCATCTVGDPQISGDNAVWAQSTDGSDYEIRFYDGSTVTTITNNSIDDRWPQVSGDNIVWVGNDGDNEIFFFNGSTVKKLTNNNVDDYDPEISGDNVVWQGLGDGADYEIFWYDGSTVTTLTNNTVADLDPSVTTAGVVWHGLGDSSYDIFVYDGDAITQLMNDASDDVGARISGNKVVWTRDDFGLEVFLGILPNTYAGISGGATVTVGFEDNVSITFDDVTSSGETSVTLRSSPISMPLPDGKIFTGGQYDITTTADYDGNIYVTIPYDENLVSDENDLRIYRWNGSSWVDKTESIDPVFNTITGKGTEFSTWVSGGPPLATGVNTNMLLAASLLLVVSGSLVKRRFAERGRPS